MEKLYKYFIITYGCQMNMYDSDLLASILDKNGYEKADNEESADIIIVNACSVREHAEKRAFGRIQNLLKYKKGRDVKIGLAGCTAERIKNEVADILPEIDFILRPNQYNKAPDIIKNSKFDISEYDTATYNGLYNTLIHSGTNFIPVIRGCNNFCTYCIVPYTRGREQSRDSDDIINEINFLYNKGVRDITLLGQNVNSYKHNHFDFPDLVKKILQRTSIPRIRFLTSHPKDLNDKLIDLIFSDKRVCKSLHLPVQSGSDRILTKMNRGYRISKYRLIIDKLRSADNKFVLTTDLIVGFPGEKKEDYNMTLDFIKETRYDFAYMFKYSPREETPASKSNNQIPEDIKSERLNNLIDIQNKISFNKNFEMIGNTYEVFFEGKSKRNINENCGRTDGNKVIIYKGSIKPVTNVIVKSIKGNTPYGVEI
jgi:tRNA-2-methylthio-N6-dimethylallyladenosine synthase